MNLVPGWAPNLHPILVHFPIALLATAAAVDLIGWLLFGKAQLRETATVLYVIGTVAAVAAYVSGRGASQTIWLPGMAQAVVKDHWNWAYRVVWFFGVMTGLRVLFFRHSHRKPGRAMAALFAMAGLLGVGLLYETGNRGGQLVYQHRVGIAPD